MKPRIRIRFGIWFCGLPCEWVRGHGYTPKEAYDDWKAQQ